MKDRNDDIRAIELLQEKIEKLMQNRASLQAEINIISQDIIRARANIDYYKKKIARKDKKRQMIDELKNGGDLV